MKNKILDMRMVKTFASVLLSMTALVYTFNLIDAGMQSLVSLMFAFIFGAVALFSGLNAIPFKRGTQDWTMFAIVANCVAIVSIAFSGVSDSRAMVTAFNQGFVNRFWLMIWLAVMVFTLVEARENGSESVTLRK